MKKHLFSLVALGLLFATAAANAQTVNLKANVPFDFIAEGKVMPKGEYSVKSIGTDGSSTLLVRSSDDRAKSLLLSHPCQAGEASAISKMVFHRYGSQYFLAQVWTLGNSSGSEFRKTSREKELARAAAASDVYVAAVR
jgi:hypothetical protein